MKKSAVLIMFMFVLTVSSNLFASGAVCGRIDGDLASTTCTVYYGNTHTISYTKNVGDECWYYCKNLEIGYWDITVEDTTPGGGSGSELKYVCVDQGGVYYQTFDVTSSGISVNRVPKVVLYGREPVVTGDFSNESVISELDAILEDRRKILELVK